MQVGQIVCDQKGTQFRLLKKVGSGSFGEIFVAQTQKGVVALKCEPLGSPHPQLVYEGRVYRELAGGPGIPRASLAFTFQQNHFMAMELLGPSLEDLFNQCHRFFSLKTVLMLADQLISRIEYIHSRRFIHRDIKPENFLVGTGHNYCTLFAIDYGLAKKFIFPNTGHHIAWRDGKSLIGTARYVSPNVHQGWEQSRRDDLKSIGYMLIYFLKGRLPWQGLKKPSPSDTNYKEILRIKLSIPHNVLCEGLPECFAQYLYTVDSLAFDETPNYDILRNVFRDCMRDLGFQYDFMFDWLIGPADEKQNQNPNINNNNNNINDDHNNVAADGSNTNDDAPAKRLRSSRIRPQTVH